MRLLALPLTVSNQLVVPGMAHFAAARGAGLRGGRRKEAKGFDERLVVLPARCAGLCAGYVPRAALPAAHAESWPGRAWVVAAAGRFVQPEGHASIMSAGADFGLPFMRIVQR